MAPVLDKLHGGVEDETLVDIRKGTGARLKKAIEAITDFSKGTEGRTSFEESEAARLREEAQEDDVTPTPEQDVNPFEGDDSSQPYTERAPSGDGMQEAYARLREAMNPQTPIWASFSDSGVEGAGYLEDMADVAARDFIKLKQDERRISQDDRRMDQTDKYSDWENKYRHTLRKSELKDMRSQDFRTFVQNYNTLKAVEDRINKAVAQSEVESMKAAHSAKIGKKDKSIEHLKNKAVIDKKIHDNKILLEKLKNGDSGMIKLGKLGYKQMQDASKTAARIQNMTETTVLFDQYSRQNKAERIKNKKAFGRAANIIGKIKRGIKEIAGEMGVTESVALASYYDNVNERIHELSGAAVTGTEMIRLRKAMANFDSNPEVFMEVWNRIVERNIAEIGQFYEMAKDSRDWGDASKGTGIFRNVEAVNKAIANHRRRMQGDLKQRYWGKDGKAKLNKEQKDKVRNKFTPDSDEYGIK